MRAIDLLADAIAAVKEGSDPRIQLEVALLKAARPRVDASIEALLMRIEQLGAAERADAGRAGGRAGQAAPKARPSRRRRRRPTAGARAAASPRRRPDGPPLVAVETLWPAVLERVRDGEGGEMLAALLADARPAALRGRRAGARLSRRPPRSASARSRTRANGERLARGAEARRRAARSGSASSCRDDAEPVDPDAASAIAEDEVIARIKDAVRRRGRRSRSRPEAARAGAKELMPQPNFNKMMKQVQQMQAEMMKAQEQLKDEVVEASAGGGMVTVKVTGDLEVKEIRIDPASIGDGELARRTSRCSRTWCSRPSTRRSAPPRSWPNRKLGGLTGGCLGDLGLPGL